MRIYSLALVTLLFASTPIFGQVEVVSSTQGGNLVTISAGNNLVGANYVHPDSFRGVVNSFVANGTDWTIGFANPGFSPGEFDESSKFPKYYIEIISPGVLDGKNFDIVSNSSSSIVVKGENGASLQNGTEVCIRKHMTLGEFFFGASSSLLAFVDIAQIFNTDGSTSNYLWNGSNWTSDFVTNDNDAPLRPGTGFLTAFGSPKVFPVSGNVKASPTQVPIFAGRVNLLSTASPVNRSFGVLNASSQMVTFVDLIQTFVQTGTLALNKTYISNGSNLTTDFVTNNDSDEISPNEVFYIAPNQDTDWVLPGN